LAWLTGAADATHHGGDSKGIERCLDCIRGLGATAAWMTPPLANQWWKTSARYSGYSAEDFKAIDAHNGSLADYQRL